MGNVVFFSKILRGLGYGAVRNQIIINHSFRKHKMSILHHVWVPAVMETSFVSRVGYMIDDVYICMYADIYVYIIL